ncbi:MAG: hypothetical protein Q4Q18_02020 [Methanobrevibacter sp.]|nr:hypothetical protein [Methanobrevibacter sp.]
MIFLDSGYFISLMYEKDPYLDNSNEPTVINTTVIVETLNRSTGTRD